MSQTCPGCGYIELVGHARTCARCGRDLLAAKPPADAAVPASWELNPQGPSFTRVTGMDGLKAHGIPERVPGVDAAQFKLSPAEGYLLMLSDGATVADDVVAASGLKPLDAAWAFYKLKEMGLIRFRTDADDQAAHRDQAGEVKDREPESVVPAARPQVAVASLVRLLETPTPKEPDQDPDVLLASSHAAFQRGDLEQARHDARLAWMLAPDMAEVAEVRRFLDAPEYAQARAQSLDGAAAAAMTQSPYQAIRLMERALAEFEALPMTHHRLAVTMLQLGQPPGRVVFHLKRALELDPGNDEAVDLLGRVETLYRGR